MRRDCGESSRGAARALFALALALALAGIAPSLARAGETRAYEVRLKGAVVGRARLTVLDEPGGIEVYTHQSRYTTTRMGRSDERVLIEEVRLKGGLFLSGWAVRELGGQRLQVVARWDEARRGVWVELDGRESFLPSKGPVGSLFDQPRRLAGLGREGRAARVFDVAEGRLGTVRLVRPQGEDGWFLTDELGVQVRTRIAPKSRLPDAFEVPDLGLRWTATHIEQGLDSARSRDHLGGGVPLSGTYEAGRRVRLVPAAAWPGLSCAGQVFSPSSAGLTCGSAPAQAGPRASAPVGPQVQALAAELDAGLPPLAKAQALAALIQERLVSGAAGAGLWESGPEEALSQGAGDCNEAAAIFAAAAPLVGLKARRRTGLAQREGGDPRVWPHAWVEVWLEGAWVRVDPARGLAPAMGLYLDLGDGLDLGARARSLTPVLKGARVEVVE